MNKSESKYFNTALKMDNALLELLNEKEFSFITVKEICQRAQVNRSTFYLHYETIGDLLNESIQYIYKQFLEYMKPQECRIVSKIKECPLENLYLITPEYLTPYLNYVKEHRKLFQVTVDNAAILQMDNTYERMFKHVFTPILERFEVPENDRRYIISFYTHGLLAIIGEWLKNDCSDSIEYVVEIVQKCINGYEEKKL